MGICSEEVYCRETAAVLSAVLDAALTGTLPKLAANLDALAAPCFVRDADSGQVYNVLGFALGLSLPTLNVAPDRAAVLANWLREKLGRNPWAVLFMLGQESLDVPPPDERRTLAAALVTADGGKYGRLWRTVWRWWGENAPRPELRGPFRELAEAADVALIEQADREKIPIWERPVFATRRTLAHGQDEMGEWLLNEQPDLGRDYDLICERAEPWPDVGTTKTQDPRDLQLRRSDVRLNVGGASAYLKMLHGWATVKRLPDREAYDRLKDARARLTELAVLLPPETFTDALITPYRFYSREYVKYDAAINRAWEDGPKPPFPVEKIKQKEAANPPAPARWLPLPAENTHNTHRFFLPQEPDELPVDWGALLCINWNLGPERMQDKWNDAFPLRIYIEGREGLTTYWDIVAELRRWADVQAAATDRPALIGALRRAAEARKWIQEAKRLEGSDRRHINPNQEARMPCFKQTLDWLNEQEHKWEKLLVLVPGNAPTQSVPAPPAADAPPEKRPDTEQADGAADTTLSYRQVAFYCIYSNYPISTLEDARPIATKRGLKSPYVLRRYYNDFASQSSSLRTGATGRAFAPMETDILAVIPLLDGACRLKAESELRELRKINDKKDTSLD